MNAIRKRIILIVLDGVGIGETEDSAEYGDEGSNTLGNIAEAVGGLNLPNMQELGLGNIADIKGVAPLRTARAAFGKMKERSRGKDSTVGHWELMGLITEKAFPTYPEGFSDEIIEEFEKAIGRKTLGNKVASGTAIIAELGDEHLRTGYPIVYTSADSVFQIAAHEDIIPVQQLYDWCQVAREILSGDNGVSRVIARPFLGSSGNFYRTANRHDFSLAPDRNLLDILQENGKTVLGVGKIIDLFAGRGVSQSFPSKGNQETSRLLAEVIASGQGDLIFANMLDFDQIFGHRNDISGYAAALEEFDKNLGIILSLMQSGDILILTADHGNDPTTPSTDHSREFVPLLVYGQSLKAGVDLGIRQSFADIAVTIADYLEVDGSTLSGESFYELLRSR